RTSCGENEEHGQLNRTLDMYVPSIHSPSLKLRNSKHSSFGSYLVKRSYHALCSSPHSNVYLHTYETIFFLAPRNIHNCPVRALQLLPWYRLPSKRLWSLSAESCF
ncbi:unnamed protein product, partial [Ectocarpus sp. 12 AP-2014]